MTCIGPECTKVAKYQTHTLCAAHAEQKRKGSELKPLQLKPRITDGHKVCTSCRRNLPLSEYWRKGAGGIQSRCKACSAVHDKARRYKVSVDAVRTMAGEACAACGRDTDLHIDHDHETGAVRGVLCRFCNASLTKHMTPEILRRLADYLDGAG